MNAQAMFGNNTTPVRVRVEGGMSSGHVSKTLTDTHSPSCSSHPFTGWTSLVTLSEYYAFHTISLLILGLSVLSEKY